MMFQVFSVDPTGDKKPQTLAIMPMAIMSAILGLHKDAVSRIVRETESNGVCSLHFSRPSQVEIFGKSVVVARCSIGGTDQ